MIHAKGSKLLLERHSGATCQRSGTSVTLNAQLQIKLSADGLEMDVPAPSMLRSRGPLNVLRDAVRSRSSPHPEPASARYASLLEMVRRTLFLPPGRLDRDTVPWEYRSCAGSSLPYHVTPFRDRAPSSLCLIQAGGRLLSVRKGPRSRRAATRLSLRDE